MSLSRVCFLIGACAVAGILTGWTIAHRTVEWLGART